MFNFYILNLNCSLVGYTSLASHESSHFGGLLSQQQWDLTYQSAAAVAYYTEYSTAAETQQV